MYESQSARLSAYAASNRQVASSQTLTHLDTTFPDFILLSYIRSSSPEYEIENSLSG